MVYDEQTWVNGPTGGTPLSAERLNHIESGVAAAWTALGVLRAGAPEGLDTFAEVDTALTALGDAVEGLASGAVSIEDIDTAVETAVMSLTRASVGLAQVDNTSDVDKPVSTATASAISTAINALTKTSVGLSNVTNTSDAAKPVSTLQQAAINVERDRALAAEALKADLVGGKIPTSQIAAISTHETVSVASEAARLALTASQIQPSDEAIVTGGASAQKGRWLLLGTDPSVSGNWLRLSAPGGVQSVNGQTLPDVVLGAADVQATPAAHATDATNPHQVTKAQVGLDAVKNVDTTTADNVAESSSRKWLTVTERATIASTVNSLLTSRRLFASTHGRIVFIVDDAQGGQKQAALKIEAVGGRMNFAIPSTFIGLNGQSMVASDVTDLYQRGHQIMCHSKTHPNMTTQTAAQRVTEWDDSKPVLEALTAVGAITDFVMPQNASNLITQQEAYGRYQRVFTAQNAPTVFRPGENGLHIGRNAWSTSTHALFLAWIRRIAVTGETYVIFCHSVDTADAASNINQTMLDEAIAVASSVGVQWVRSDEALVAHQPFFDPFLQAPLGMYHTIVSKTAGSTIDLVNDVPDGLPANTRAVRMVNPGDGLNRVAFGGYSDIVKPGEEYTCSIRIRQDKTSGTGGAQLFVRQYDEFGGNIGDVNGTVLTPANAAAVTPWGQVSVSLVPDKKTRTLAFTLWQPSMVGTTWATHPHLAPTRLGLLA